MKDRRSQQLVSELVLEGRDGSVLPGDFSAINIMRDTDLCSGEQGVRCAADLRVWRASATFGEEYGEALHSESDPVYTWRFDARCVIYR